MQTLQERLFNNLFTPIYEELDSVFKRTAKNAEETGKILDKLQALGVSLKGEKISLDNKIELRKVFKKFINSLSFGSDSQNRQAVKKYGLATEEGFRNFILSNHDNLEKAKIDTNWVKQFDETAMEKEYKSWKNSNEYVAGVKGEDFNDESDSGAERDLVVYNRWNPDTFMIWQNFKGKRGKSTDKFVNMCRVEFHYEYDVKYYDCYPILANHYFGHEDELKKRAELQLGYEDPNEFK